ncbi:GNAT family N-acetyltransferase [Arsenicibacter rosenii]|nr:GNAT family N-acetyltransferase [Arsenicibacter rosenii]
MLTSFGASGFLYNDDRHLRIQGNQVFHHFCIIDQQTGQPVARCTFFQQSSRWYSPFSAPFGSLECTILLPGQVLDALIERIESEMRTLAIDAVSVKQPPDCYAPEQTTLFMERLLKKGFRITSAPVVYYLPVTSDDLRTRMAAQEVRRLQKSERAGFTFRQLTELQPDQVIAYWQQRRAEQRYPLTIAPEQLRLLLTEMPDRFPVFVVESDGEWAAMSVCVRVSASILYHFLPVDTGRYRSVSPMVMLIHGLYQYCQQQGIRLLDLGVSLDDHRQPKPGLIRFKRNMGGLPSPKLSFEKWL